MLTGTEHTKERLSVEKINVKETMNVHLAITFTEIKRENVIGKRKKGL